MMISCWISSHEKHLKNQHFSTIISFIRSNLHVHHLFTIPGHHSAIVSWTPPVTRSLPLEALQVPMLRSSRQRLGWKSEWNAVFRLQAIDLVGGFPQLYPTFPKVSKRPTSETSKHRRVGTYHDHYGVVGLVSCIRGRLTRNLWFLSWKLQISPDLLSTGSNKNRGV